MKKQLFGSGVAGGIPRNFSLLLAMVLLLGALAAQAQQAGGVIEPLQKGNQQPSTFAGTWRGVYQGITITTVFQPNGQYIQTEQKGTLMTQQSGPYKLVAPNTIVFSVTNWQPKTMPVYHPTGTVGGYYTQEPMAKPPGATDTYVFKGSNTVVLTDQMMHGSITMNRVQ